MYKDLARFSAVWRALFRGAGSPLLLLVFTLSKNPPKMVLRRMMGLSLETGPVLDALLSVNYCANFDSVSVMAVREKCDEKEQGQSSDFVCGERCRIRIRFHYGRG